MLLPKADGRRNGGHGVWHVFSSVVLSVRSLTVVEQVRDVPEMGPAMPWIDNYIEESQLLAVNTSVYDPNVGRLLDFGTATDREGHSERSFEVAGFACGLTGSDLGALNRAGPREDR